MSKNTTNNENAEDWEDIDFDDTALQSILDNPLEGSSNISHLRFGTQCDGFDNNMGDSWIYPNNLPLRSYQMSIVQAALYRNTLVVLPTGLGKTFIAAVVMYNFYRWYPKGKVLFLAPTRPLVNQQIEACKNIMPFPKRDTIELTGKLNRPKRAEMWKTKRVFFATPHVVQSDMFGGRPQDAESIDENSFHGADASFKTDFQFDLIKLVVIDEAHKAKGKYAFTEVVQGLLRSTKNFRVLALSATPGRTVDDVAEVCRNLLISHVEVRWDTSLDVLPYVHKKTIDTVVVSMGDKIKELREQILTIVDPYLRYLTEAGVISGSLANINRNFLLFEQKRFRDRSFHAGHHPQHSAITTNFALCISLYHALELLERHGLRVFLNYFEEDEEGKNKFILNMERRLYEIVEQLKKEMGPNPFEFSAAPMTNGKIAEIPKDLDFGHPKFEKTRECLLKHFENNKDSRAIVFCEYRESVMLIYRMLLQHVPMLRPRCFVGQGGSGSLRALTQKQQIQIMNDFRSGKSNVLIATSIGEEGIDVGEVELIVCFDISTSNPMRFVQRIGRTGRKKNGHVIMMVTEGREQQLLREVLSNKDQINKKLLRSSVVQQSMYKQCPRLVPTEFKPKCIQAFVKPPSDDEEKPTTKQKKISNNKKTTPKKIGQDLRNFFQKKSKELDKEDLEYFENGTQISQVKPGLQTQQNIVNKLDKMKNLFKDLQSPIATQTQKNIKNSQIKLTNTQGSIKNFFKDSKETNQTNESLNNSKKSLDLSVLTIDLCEGDSDPNHTEMADLPTVHKIDDTERLAKFKKFLKSTIISKKDLKRAEIAKIEYHLNSTELSREMKKLLLTTKPDFIKDNFDKMEVLKALYDQDETNFTEQEISIREINRVILDLFGGQAEVERLLDAVELDIFKRDGLDSDSETEDEDPQDMENFQKKLNNIFKVHCDGTTHDNYDWIQKRLKETKYYKEKTQSVVQNNVQESMVYDTFAENDDENTINFEDCSIIESKYCGQWQEFNKTDIACNSTPVQGTKKLFNRETISNKSPLLGKMEDDKAGQENEENRNDDFNSSATNTKQVQNVLLVLENKLKETSINETKTKSSQPDVDKSKRNDCTKFLDETGHKVSSDGDFEDFCALDELDLVMAAEEAELKLTQNPTKENSFTSKDITRFPSVKEDTNIAKEESNHSLNSTPELDLSSYSINKSATSSHIVENKKSITNLDLQQELDIDLEAFMEPFPEEQELLKNSPSFRGKESFKKNLINKIAPPFVRESPDLFAEEHTKTTIQKPTACRKPTLANKLSEKLKLQKCQSSLNPTTILKSPQKPLYSTQQFDSPSSRLGTDKQKFEKSPSLFDMYIKNTKGKGKLPKSFANSTALTSSVNITNSSMKESPVITTSSQQNESVVLLRNRKGIASKRKIFDSDSEHEKEDGNSNLNGLSAITSKDDDNTDSELEEVAATQRPYETSIFHQRRKRRRLNSFIQQEAGVSGSEQSEDETEHTIGHYVYDSIVVSSDEDDPDQASTSHMQAVYLQSLKSPQQRRGAFKIPAPRVFNDHSRIFSQPVIPGEALSQYVDDSFIVEEDDSIINKNAEMSMCPLERAEKILKERRKAKKLGILEKGDNKRRPKMRAKLPVIEDSSEDDDFE